MAKQKVVAFFPEAAFGPALNSVGIAQACERLGHKAVFFTDPGMGGVYKGYGFEERLVNMSEPMPPEAMAKYWSDFINGHIPNFDKTPYEQIGNYVKECWEAIVDTSVWAEKELPAALEEHKPDAVCVDNVVLFPAIKRYSKETGSPWLRIISCSENEIPDADIPPHLSGCGESDKACFAKFEARFNEVVAPVHGKFNEFLAECGEEPYPAGQFFEASPFMNLLLYPEPVKFRRSSPLDEAAFQYLEGCVREDAEFEAPDYGEHGSKPLVYVSFGSLGSGDTPLLKRIIAVLGKMPVRGYVNVGDYEKEYAEGDIPANVRLTNWCPQPAVIRQSDAVIHHGGNNSFNECLYFGKPAIVMPYVWDGHDNARRAQETGHGLSMHRSSWTEGELTEALGRLLEDRDMKAKLAETSKWMQSRPGTEKAARIIDELLQRNG